MTEAQEQKLPSANESAAADHSSRLAEIIAQYDGLAHSDEKTAVELSQEYLQHITENPDLLRQPEYSGFLARHIEPEAVAAMEWESPHHMVLFSESLYHSQFVDEEMAQKLDQHARILLRHALQEYEKEGELEKMFRLLRLAPSYLLQQDNELSRLHYRANNYEIRRVRRSRRLLYSYLIIQAILVLFIFPYLFINAENQRLQNQVEQMADVELGDDGYQTISYPEGVYWAIITAASIGYGDITPTTNTGRMIASILGTMGVVTVGILAGLVLDWITPRRIT
jgi:hypothetical protein